MPIYEYACQDCGKQFETLVRSDTVPQCPVCHSTHLEKQLSVFATSGGDAAAGAASPGACAACPSGGGGGGGGCAFA